MYDSDRPHIRAFLRSDYHFARVLWEQTEGMGLNESDTEVAVESFLRRNPGCSAVAISGDGAVVGAVLCGHDGRRGFLNHLAVAPAYRSRGIARQLVEFCFAQLAAAGIPRCNVFVYDDNGSGIQFWLHNGWSEAAWKTLQKRVAVESLAEVEPVPTTTRTIMARKYPPEAYSGWRAVLPDWFVGWPTAGDQKRAVRLLELRPGDCVCDAACGSGFNLQRLVKAVGPGGLVVAVEDNPHLLMRCEAKIRNGGWRNVRLHNQLDAALFDARPVDGIIVSYNPPIFLQRPDLLEAAWQLLKPTGRMALVAGRCTTPIGRAIAPALKLGIRVAGHEDDWRYWLVHEPWQHLSELAGGRLWVEPRWGFQYLLWAKKGA